MTFSEFYLKSPTSRKRAASASGLPAPRSAPHLKSRGDVGERREFLGLRHRPIQKPSKLDGGSETGEALRLHRYRDAFPGIPTHVRVVASDLEGTKIPPTWFATTASLALPPRIAPRWSRVHHLGNMAGLIPSRRHARSILAACLDSTACPGRRCSSECSLWTCWNVPNARDG